MILEPITYRDCSIEHNRKPIRGFDWEWTHPAYDGPEAPHLTGCCGTIEECKAQIDEMYAEHLDSQEFQLWAGTRA